MNLRGVRESGIAFALPTYSFVAVMYVMIAVGVGKCAVDGCPQAHVPDPIAVGAAGSVGVLVVLRAFASGAAALTGVESISNGVGAFKSPQGQNAAKTLVVMGVMAISLFIGVSYLAVHMHALPSNSVSVVSEIARATFPAGSPAAVFYYLVQGLTFAILVLAANTSYQGFPRLSAILARDRFFPRQFVNLGDRLVYSNGIIVLAGVASLLIWAFKADVNALIHLYVIGVFTAFTLSQAGMVRYWRRAANARLAAVGGDQRRRRGRDRDRGVARHRDEVPRRAPGRSPSRPAPRRRLLPRQPPLPQGRAPPPRRALRRSRRRRRRRTRSSSTSSRYDAALREAVWYARQIAGDDFRAIHVPGPHSDTGIRPRFRQLTDIRPDLEIVRPEDGRVDAVIDYLWALPRGESNFVTVDLPEQFQRPSLVSALAQRTEFSLKLRLLSEPGVVITDVPVAARASPASGAPQRAVCRVLVSGRMRRRCARCDYAETLGLADTKARLLRLRRRGGRADPDRVGAARRCRFRSTSRRRTSATSATRCSATSRGITADPDASRWSSCRSSSSAARSGCCTISARSTSSGCCCSSRA